MKKILLLFFFSSYFLTNTNIYSNEDVFVEKNSSFERRMKAVVPKEVDEGLASHFSKMNPFVRYEFTELSDTIMLNSGRLVYDVKYKIGKGGMRVVPNSISASKHLIISGDSTVFGVGVFDHQTIPYYLQKRLNKYEVFNFGIGGGGPTNLHYFFDHYGLKKILANKPQKGIFIYQFEYYLIERIIGTKNFIKWGGRNPFYREKNGKFFFDGTFDERWISKFYQLLNSFPILDKYIPNLPRITDDDIELTARMLSDLGRKYKESTSLDNQFYVLINPRGLSWSEKKIMDKMKHFFKANGLNVFAIEFDEIGSMDVIQDDGHFSAKGNEYIANRILDLFKLN